MSDSEDCGDYDHKLERIAETCWGGPATREDMPLHEQVTCIQHGHIMATCTPQNEGGNCLNLHPKTSYATHCLVVCPNYLYTDKES